MPEPRGSITGSHSDHEVVFYGLSTCVWCKRTRKLLEDLDVSFEFTYVDLLSGEERNQVLDQVRRWNPAASFPTLVVDGDETVVGYRPDEIKEALGQ